MSHSEFEVQPDAIIMTTGEIGEIKLAVVMQPSNILGYDDEDNLCQLWFCQNTGQKEWRKIGYISEMEI